MDIPEIVFPSNDKDFISNPYPYLKELREESPLHLDTESGLVLVTHFEDVKNVQKSKNFSSSEPENYQKKDGSWGVKNKMVNSCWRMWQSCVITWDGGVVPCCFDKDATHQLGQLQTTDFKKIWSGKRYQNFRGALLKSRSEIDICKNCTEGTKVWG